MSPSFWGSAGISHSLLSRNITLVSASVFTQPPPCGPICDQIASVYNDTRHVGSGPTVMNSCPLGPLHKDPVCKSGPILGCWGLGLRHRSLGTSLTVSLVVRSSVPISQMRTPWPWRGGGCLSYLLRRECAPRGLPPALVSVASGCTKPFVEGNPGPRRLLQ